MAKYTVTDTAPPRVAGRRIKPGDSLELTDRAAAYELTAGHIRPFEEPSKASEITLETSPKSTSKKGSS